MGSLYRSERRDDRHAHLRFLGPAQGFADQVRLHAGEGAGGGQGPDRQGKGEKAMNPLQALKKEGQAVWLDFLARRFIAEGGLKRLVDEDGLAGVTSNPSIFEKAIGETADYDSSLKEAEAKGDADVGTLYERLAIADIQHAADVLRPVYDATKRGDGYLSLEVSPYLAGATAAAVAEARPL